MALSYISTLNEPSHFFASKTTFPALYESLPGDKKFRLGAQYVMWHNNQMVDETGSNVGLRWDVSANYIGTALNIILRVDDKQMKEHGYSINNLKRFLEDLPKTVPSVCQAFHVWENEFMWLDSSESGDPAKASTGLYNLLQDMLTTIEMLVYTCGNFEAQNKAIAYLSAIGERYHGKLPQPKQWTLTEPTKTLEKEKKPKPKTPPPPFDQSVIEQNKLNAQASGSTENNFLLNLLEHYDIKR